MLHALAIAALTVAFVVVLLAAAVAAWAYIGWVVNTPLNPNQRSLLEFFGCGGLIIFLIVLAALVGLAIWLF